LRLLEAMRASTLSCTSSIQEEDAFGFEYPTHPACY
jgi:hypothetical protein